MPNSRLTRPGSTPPRLIPILALLLLAGSTARVAAGAEPAAETWCGTWNAPNLWRSVELTLRRGAPGASTFAIGTARDRVAATTRSCAVDDTSLAAVIDYAGAVVTLDGRLRGGAAEGRLKVARGGTVLTEGSWTLKRRRPSDRSAEALLKEVRAAMKFPGALASGYTLEQAPAPVNDAAPAAGPGWTARVGARGELAIDEGGAPTFVFDGAGVRMERAPFGWLPVDARLREKTLLAEVVRSFAWLLPRSTLECRAWMTGDDGERRYVLELTTAAGVVPARVTIDPATWRPDGAVVAWDAGERSFRFADYVELGGCLFPGRITSAYRGKAQEWRAVRIVPGAGAFSMPVVAGVGYDAGASPVLPGTHGAGNDGHLFVRPLVNGHDLGWFHIDTGAPFMLLDARLADSLGLPVVRAMGSRSVRRIPEIRIGQLVLKDQPALVQDLSDFSAPDSARRAGVIGGPAFENAVVEFDYTGRRLSVFAPGAFREKVPAWLPMTLEGPPVVDATCDGVPARFMLDTGKSATVSLLSHAAARGGLYANHTFQEVANETVEGTTLELVTHLRSFTLAGQEFTSPEVYVKLPGTTNDEIGTTSGIIGRGFFQDRRIVFDYARGRIGFLPQRR